jgi:hypothetical protein
MSSGAAQPGLSFIGLACYRKDARNGQRFQHRRFAPVHVGLIPKLWIRGSGVLEPAQFI